MTSRVVSLWSTVSRGSEPHPSTSEQALVGVGESLAQVITQRALLS